MEISREIQKYVDDIIRMSYESYKKEIGSVDNLLIKPFDAFKEYILSKLENVKGLVYLEEEQCRGYILYHTWEEGTDYYCRIPEWGYGAQEKREKIISRLFQALAEEIVKERTVNFSVNLYAHDVEIQRLFSYMEFGIQAETGIRFLKKADNLNGVEIRELSKEEMENRWKEIWGLLAQLIHHLEKSPVFYPGEEFTEEVYREFFEDEGTRVYIAEEEGKIIGLFESNVDNIPLIFADNEAANVGEAFVLPEYRGKGIAEALLYYVEQDLLRGNYHYAWVEHGTANPNARYFWNKYFTTYKYEMIRKING